MAAPDDSRLSRLASRTVAADSRYGARYPPYLPAIDPVSQEPAPAPPALPEGHPLIQTPDQRLRVFVSFTLSELAEERRAVSRAISALRLTPVLFELGARPHPPQELYRAYLAQSDVFIGLYWQRYGQLVPGARVSGLGATRTLAGYRDDWPILGHGDGFAKLHAHDGAGGSREGAATTVVTIDRWREMHVAGGRTRNTQICAPGGRQPGVA